MESGTWISVIPALAVLVVALLTRKSVEALLFGSLLGFVMLSGMDFFDAFVSALSKVMADGTVSWIILVCGLFGSLIRLLIQSGGATAFGEWMGSLITGRRSALLSTWILGLVIFVDDYLNALTVGSSMKRITDRFKVSREMLAYVVDSTAAPICVLVPLSTWAIFVAGLLEDKEFGVAAEGEGMSVYISVIPYILYAWVAAILVPLVAIGLIPPLGPMKKAEQRALAGEKPIELPLAAALEKQEGPLKLKPNLIDFILPIAVLIVATWYLEILKGVLCALAATAVLAMIRRSMSFDTFSKSVFEGFQTMIPALAVVVMSFVLLEVNDGLGLTDFVIQTVKPWMSPSMLPAVAFLSLSLVTFATGSFWGVYAVTLPIIIPLASELGTDQSLAIGAVISAGAFGSHACIYGDSTVLSATAAGCDNVSHALTQLPYALLAAAITTLGFVLLGWSMG